MAIISLLTDGAYSLVNSLSHYSHLALYTCTYEGLALLSDPRTHDLLSLLSCRSNNSG